MAHEPEIIHVDPGSDLDRIIEEAGDRPVVLQRKGIRYRLNRESLTIADENDLWADYNPERA